MNCEICGTEIKGQPYKTKIDNSVMITCKECSSYGKVQQAPQNPRNRNNKKGNNRRSQQKRSYSRPSKPEYELVDDYAKIVRQAREKKHLTQKQLGEKLYERESVIAHIESSKMVPETKLAKKLEKILNIKIIEKVEDAEQQMKDAFKYREATIGDIAKITRK